MKKNLLLLLFPLIWSQESIAEGMSGDALVNYLQTNYKTSSTLGYNTARDILYLDIERK